MEKILVSIAPGFAFTCGAFLLLLSGVQLRIYFSKKYKRSRSLALFCFFSGFFALEHFVAQSRVFSPEFTHAYVGLSTLALCLSLAFYITSLSYFVAIPSWLFKTYRVGSLAVAFVTFIGVVASLAGGRSWFFHAHDLLHSGNYFVDSYTVRIGHPRQFINIILSITGVITVGGASVLLRRVLRTSRDTFFILGLMFSIVAAILENFLLPFTYSYFFPVVFMANLFEAFRMNSLSYREYVREKMARHFDQKVESESEKYQNSNLTEKRISELAKKLQTVLEKDKVYLNPNLSSESLAKKIGIPPYQLSQVVNIGLNTTFFELVSQYRIEEVKQRLKDEQYADETIINIAYSSGFNSKSAFNTAFKKQTGMTPSKFRKS